LSFVFTRDEVRRVLIHLDGVNRKSERIPRRFCLTAVLRWLRGASIGWWGVCCMLVRVKDIEFGYRQIVVRDGKGA